MAIYRVREVKIIETGPGGTTEKSLREYERQSSDRAGMIAQVGHFFEMELSGPKALQTVDFDAIIIIDAGGVEVARFSVSEFWCSEWRDTVFNQEGTVGYRPETLST
jgi:hypothetical protein